MIPYSYRFHGYNALRYVYKNGTAVRSHHMTVKAVRNSRRKTPRFSVVVSKKVLKSAVGRNRIRRRVYEAIRLRLHEVHYATDVVVIITSKELISLSHRELCDQLDYLFQSAGICNSTQ